MSQGRAFLLDEMLSPAIAEQLRQRRHDAVAIVERPEWVSLPDTDVLAIASAESRCLVTCNVRDFAVLDADWKGQGRHHGGIICVATTAFPQDRSFVGAVVTSLDDAARDGRLPAEDELGFLVRR